MEDFQARFIEDASELISDLEDDVLNLENNTDNKDLIERIFRVMHTLKGVSAMYGFDKIGELTHHLETIYDFVREDKVSINRTILDVTFISVDVLRNLLADANLLGAKLKKDYNNLFEKVVELAQQIKGDKTEIKIEDTNKIQSNSEFATYHIVFRPEIDILLRGVNIFSLFQELKELGEIIVVPHISSKIPNLIDLDPVNLFFFWEIYLVTNKSFNDIEDVFIFVDLEYTVKKLTDCNLFKNNDFKTKIKVSLYEEAITEDNLQKIIDICITKEKEDETEKNKEEPEEENSLKKQLTQLNFVEQKTTSIRVDAEKLDELMNLVSELVTTQAELSLIAETNSKIGKLSLIAENVEKLSIRLRDNAFNIRLIPIKKMLVRFQRLFRDLSHELHKEISFITEGIDTELDKTIIDALASPLMHIFRNCIDHGIELPEIREKLNKDREGKIHFRAFSSGTSVIIQIEDDGAGIDPYKIRDKAIEKDLIRKDVNLTEKEMFELIFLPGFSTAKEITDVSGRGVGMDVVKKRISSIRGEVEIASQIGEGTVISITLPLTLSIVDALLVKLSDTYFLIPISVVENCNETSNFNLKQAVNNRLVLNGELLPFIYLRKEFGIKTEGKHTDRIVVIKYEDKKVALIVDKIIGKHQAVLKPLGEIYDNKTIISRASILGNGDIALVMDTNKLIKDFLLIKK